MGPNSAPSLLSRPSSRAWGCISPEHKQPLINCIIHSLHTKPLITCIGYSQHPEDALFPDLHQDSLRIFISLESASQRCISTGDCESEQNHSVREIRRWDPTWGMVENCRSFHWDQLVQVRFEIHDLNHHTNTQSQE